MAYDKLFLVGVCDVVALDDNGQMLYNGKTELSTGIEVSTSNTDIRAGKGNGLQYVYYHTGAMSLNLEDAQFNLGLICMTTGGIVGGAAGIFGEETAAIAGNQITLVGTPVAQTGAGQAYAYVRYKGMNYSLPVTGKNIDATALVNAGATGNVCVAYLKEYATTDTFTIPSRIVPKIAHIYMNGDLATNEAGDGIVGRAHVEIPRGQFSGAVTLSMTSDGYSTTPVTINALEYADINAGCANNKYYAKITQEIFDANWYDNVIGLAIADGDFTLAKGATKTLQVYAVTALGSFLCDNKKLTFSSGTAATATVGANTGVVTATQTEGTSLITAKITKIGSGADPGIEASCTVTVQ